MTLLEWIIEGTQNGHNDHTQRELLTKVSVQFFILSCMHFKCCIQKNWSIDDSSNCSEIRENSQIVVVINRVNYCNCICKTSSCKGAARSWSRGGSHQTLTGVESLRRWGEAGAEAGWGEFSFFLWLLILLLPRCCIAFILIFNCVASISLHINPPTWDWEDKQDRIQPSRLGFEGNLCLKEFWENSQLDVLVCIHLQMWFNREAPTHVFSKNWDFVPTGLNPPSLPERWDSQKGKK